MKSLLQPKIIRSLRSSISIQINSKGEVIVKAPRLMPMFMIKKFISAKQNWIEKNLGKVHSKKPKTKQYKDGEEFMYLGNLYKLRLGNYTEISVTDVLQFPKFLEFRIEKELRDWYIRKAKEKITQRLEFHAKHMQATYKGVLFSDTISKWGTCFSDNSLQFNFRLVMAPLIVLDYVVIHELAHTSQKNHSAKFWSLVDSFTPAYRQHRKWLNAHAHLLQF